MKIKLTIIALCASLTGCFNQTKTLELGNEYVLPSGSDITLFYAKDQSYPVNLMGKFSPIDCVILGTEYFDSLTKRVIIRASEFKCGDSSLQVEGYAVGNDMAVGLRADPVSEDVLEKDQQFKLYITKPVSLKNMTFEYTESEWLNR
ncbi:hypothetical protein IB292_02340 [Vibrio parahaemolyticus]|uniref:Lipoprotein n=1 Tax=Vibrio parahaemolyticus TaxID=670 RepID=A0A9Q3U7X8_VIBPH|nr:hypothetical protein [Vibrio parahaemolyticus]MCC3803868.1 hypothetical protein [Vibrio parahaemolyticus]